ncbi:MAG TPA: VIT1/CCC1 transporter family protein [Candidatus Saccharimonadales bacterium]
MRERIERHLGQLVYGAIDGTVTTFAVVAAAAGAQLNPLVIIVLGLANLVADGFSMGASAYLSAKSERDLEQSHGEGEYQKSPISKGTVTFAAFVVAGFVPLLAYVVDGILGLRMDKATLFSISCFLTGATFMGIGILKGQLTKTSPLKAALETLLLGGIAAGLAYLLGDVLAGALGAK